MNQSNALRQLEIILDGAVQNGKPSDVAGLVILKEMGLPSQAINLINFYEILAKAYLEAKSIRTIGKLPRYLIVLEELQNFIVENHIWSAQWASYNNYIKVSNCLITIDSLANELYRLNPLVALDENFLQQLHDEFDLLLKQISESDLSPEIKQTLLIKVEAILKAISHYKVEGTEGIQQAGKLALFDLATEENEITKEEKKHPLFKKFKSSAITLCGFFLTTIGVVPDIDKYWIPKIQEYQDTREKIEQMLDEESSIETIYERALPIFKGKKMKAITGKEQPALPPSREDIENKTEGEIKTDGEINP